MDNTQIPSFEIPKSAESTPVYTGGAEFDPSLRVEETKEILPAPSLQKHATASSVADQPVLPPPTAPTAAPTTVAVDDTHVIADDVDVIEKEWVDRAKKIISLTSDDPYVETKEIGKLKATYMKKRFNKDIPLPVDGVS